MKCTISLFHPYWVLISDVVDVLLKKAKNTDFGCVRVLSTFILHVFTCIIAYAYSTDATTFYIAQKQTHLNYTLYPIALKITDQIT